MAIPVLEAPGTALKTVGTLNHDVAYPATVNSGDLLLMVIGVGIDRPVTGGLEDWTLIKSETVLSEVQIHIYSIVADGTETGTITVQMSSAVVKMFQIHRVTGGTLIEGVLSSKATSKTIDHPDIVSSAAERLALSFTVINDNETGASFTGETGGDLTLTFDELTTEGNDLAVSTQEADMATSGTIAGGTWTYGGATEVWVTIGFAVYQAASGSQTDKSISFATVTGMALTKFPIRPRTFNFAMVTEIDRSLITSKPFGVNFTTGMGVAKETQKTFTVDFATAMALSTARLVVKAISFGMSTAMGLTKIISKPFSVAFSTSMTLAKKTQQTITVAFNTAMSLAKTTFPNTKAVAFVTTMVTTAATLFQKAFAFGMTTSMALVKQTNKALSVTFNTGMGITREVQKTIAVAFSTAFTLARKTSVVKTVAFVTAMATTILFALFKTINVTFPVAMSLVKQTQKTFTVGFATGFSLAKTTKVAKAVSFVTSMVTSNVLLATKAISFSFVTNMALSKARFTFKAISVAFVTAMSTVTDFTVGSGVFGRIIWLLRRRRR